MKSTKREFLTLIAAGLTLMLPNAAWGEQHARTAESSQGQSKTASDFYCNTKALDPAERTLHKQLSEKLMAAPKKTVEMEAGYEFRLRPDDFSLLELAQWVRDEAKCCPFFDFHIDLEEKGSLLCLRLSGKPGIKDFIRSEFEAAIR